MGFHLSWLLVSFFMAFPTLWFDSVELWITSDLFFVDLFPFEFYNKIKEKYVFSYRLSALGHL